MVIVVKIIKGFKLRDASVDILVAIEGIGYTLFGGHGLGQLDQALGTSGADGVGIEVRLLIYLGCDQLPIEAVLIGRGDNLPDLLDRLRFQNGNDLPLRSTRAVTVRVELPGICFNGLLTQVLSPGSYSVGYGLIRSH